ncbi:hypothetical protein LJC61_02430 [Ruminococcaceae bacterium OttesenSCG-928-A16]|nr:hypothetical protein [Ruminococcaceae bacterium OttesenSCG-928-A16]
MPLVYQDTFKVYQFECDPWDRMTPGAILRRVQEIGTQHCEQLGLTEEHYQATHTVFLLSRISLEIYNAPTTLQEVRIETRAYGMHRAVFQRVTSMYNAQTGEKLCEADSRWVLVDTNTRRILRREPEGFNNPFTEAPGQEEHSMEAPKPGEVQSFGTRTASYMLCDRNGHLNNTRYADLVCDCLPLQELAQNQIKKMLLFYKAEIPLGKSFSLYGGKAEGEPSTYYFVAEENGRKNFEAFVTL